MSTVIIGIDPGSHRTGYGIIQQQGNRLTALNYGVVETKADELADRLLEIYQGLKSVLHTCAPTQAAIENVFVKANVQSALKLGQARGVALVTLAESGLQVANYSPRQIKNAVVGYGHADKNQVQHMVKMILGLDKVPPQDAADALAIAICHAHHLPIKKLQESSST